MVLLALLFTFLPAHADWHEHWEKIPLSALPEKIPDGDLKSFRLALDRQLENCREHREGRHTHCGNGGSGPALECDEPALEKLRALSEETKNWKSFYAKARPAFDWYRYKESVLFTGYNSPSFPASLTKTKTFAFPLYSPPPDLQPKQYDREAIEVDRKLAGREIAWLSSPADVLRLQIEGSGILLAGRKQIGVNYAAKNGFPYVSIFKTLKGEVPATFPALREFAAAHPQRFQEALLASPSYVFFELTNEPACGTARVHVTGGFSLAVDPTQLPLGLPAFLAAERPKEGIDPDAKKVPVKPFTRFAFAQDTGGAIKGAHVDIYFGTDRYAMLASNTLRSHGQLFLLRSKVKAAE